MPIIGPIIDSQYLVNNIPRFHGRPVESITAQERTEVALELRSTSEADVDKKLADLKSKNPGVNTLGKYYNATGETIKLHGQYSWHGNFVRQGGGNDQSQYNGQWAVFIHNDPSGEAAGSAGAFILGNSSADILLSFLTPGDRSYPRVYVEIRNNGHFTDDLSKVYYSLLNSSTDESRDRNLGLKAKIWVTDVTTTGGVSATADATLTPSY